MIRLVYSIAIGIMLTGIAVAQGSRHMESPDTSVAMRMNLNSYYPDIHLPEIFQPSMRFSPSYRPSLLQPSFPYALQPFTFQLQEKIDLTSPWEYELADRGKMRTMYMILGGVQTGAVCYMAYKHLKKYRLK